jgi:Flp pilus assembly protein TadD
MSYARELLALDTQTINLSTVVQEGIACCQADDWEGGLALLRKAARKEVKESKLPSLYYSYLGYGAANFEGERKDGLALCLHAVRVGREEPENYLNLARVYLLAGDRRRAVAAIQHGLKVDSRHPGLLEQRSSMGYRRKPVISFLSRDAWLNRFLGRRRHRRLGEELPQD